MQKYTVLLFWLALSFNLFANDRVERVEPPFWWAGMNHSQLQLLIYGENVSVLEPRIDYEGVGIIDRVLVENPNYLFVNLQLDEDVQPGRFPIEFMNSKGKEVYTYTYELLKRESGSADRKGFDPSDVMYLITPDRFANGNENNDEVEGYTDPLNRADKDGRHGGDLAGISQHLDYIKDMGFTVVWLNPVLENNMQRTSYHGYATTDYYRVDPRYGSNAAYKELGKKCNEMGIKLIMDMIMNHCGSEHWWMKDLPSDDWINYGGSFVQTNHRRTTVRDPYVAPSEKILFSDGWFVDKMPDLNQRNPLLAKYLIQNSIWWVEYAGLKGIRHDTHSYPDKDFMSDWTCALMDEYPNFNIVGEEWSIDPATVSYWQKGKQNADGYTSCLVSLMDFPLQYNLIRGLNEDPLIYTDGFIRMYETLANDYQYANPYELVIFPDNHDMSRFYTQINEDYDLFKMGIAYILTMRGTPQLYYGTEILMTNPNSDAHGEIRGDFPGGWAGDQTNAFVSEGLSEQQIEAQTFVKKLLNWRKDKSVVHNGKLMHYNPIDEVYVYFRYDDRSIIMVVLNKRYDEYEFDYERFNEIIKNKTLGTDIIHEKRIDLTKFTLPARSAYIIELE